MLLLLTKLAQMEIDEMNGVEKKSTKKKNRSLFPKETVKQNLPKETEQNVSDR